MLYLRYSLEEVSPIHISDTNHSRTKSQGLSLMPLKYILSRKSIHQMEDWLDCNMLQNILKVLERNGSRRWKARYWFELKRKTQSEKKCAACQKHNGHASKEFKTKRTFNREFKLTNMPKRILKLNEQAKRILKANQWACTKGLQINGHAKYI